MSGAPIVVHCYRNGVDSYGTWITDPAILGRIRNLAREGGKSLVADVIWYHREPWTKQVTDAWCAVDSFDVSLDLDHDRPEPLPPPETASPRKRKKR
jgi:hypothetical protein